jgi:serine/threonine protein kinase
MPAVEARPQWSFPRTAPPHGHRAGHAVSGRVGPKGERCSLQKGPADRIRVVDDLSKNTRAELQQSVGDLEDPRNLPRKQGCPAARSEGSWLWASIGRVVTAIRDTDLLGLVGLELQAGDRPPVRYTLGAVIGEGAHGVVFAAQRRSEGVTTEVVLKILRPRAVRELGALAGPTIAKEVAALRKLSEVAPMTPYVVSFLDAGTVRLGDSPLALPWIALEYVEGGPDGVTLRARVENAVAKTGRAFDLPRAQNAVHCLTAGVAAIHNVGVIHRDITPNNVLACGVGRNEVLKISDFGVARVSSATTFGDVLLGTPGYCAPEQSFPEKIGIGPYTDVFGLACTIYFVLTGERYFNVRSIPETLVAVHQPERRTILEAQAVDSTLREQPSMCTELDRIFARATRANPGERLQSAQELGASLLSALHLL